MALSVTVSGNQRISGLYKFSGGRTNPRGCFTLHNGERVFFKQDALKDWQGLGKVLTRLTMFGPRDNMSNLVRFFLSYTASMGLSDLVNDHFLVGHMVDLIQEHAEKKSAREALIAFQEGGPPYSLQLVFLFDRVLPDHLSP